MNNTFTLKKSLDFVKIILFSLTFFFSSAIMAQNHKVTVDASKEGYRMLINGEPFFVNGINWDYFPIGTNYNYSLWNQPDEFIKKALDDEMTLLKNMGVNTIRVYTGIQQKWIQYIYENYGIYSMLNHSFGRYGLTIDGAWQANTDYTDPKVRELLIREVREMVASYKNKT